MFSGTEQKAKNGELNGIEQVVSKKKSSRLFLIIAGCVLVVALAVSGILILGNHQKIERIIDYGTVLKGVQVNGIDISQMTKEEVMQATADIESDLLGKVKISLDVNGMTYEYAADDFNVSTDYEGIITKAIAFGHTGTFDERKKAFDTAINEGKQFTVKLTVDHNKLQTALTSIKNSLDTLPQDANAEFMPCGYTEDGKAYEPDAKEMADIHSKGKENERPELVCVDDEENLNKLRYQYWKEDHYVEDYIPKDANISRFLYTPEVTGLVADTDAIKQEILTQIESGEFSTIKVPVKVTKASVNLEDIKKNTQLIASWSSSYRDHSNNRRDWNVSRMSSFVNGAKILPGQEWSVNDTAGGRTSATAKTIGWKKAGGLLNGGSTQQYGGGVCQLGSTTYNAALRAGLKIKEFHHHSIPSAYIPKGIDATLDTRGLDLVLRNDGDNPFYLVSYVDPKEMNVTVEVYGQLPFDSTYNQEVIYDFTSDNKGWRYGSPGMRTITATEAPNGTVLGPDLLSYVFAKPRRGTKVQVYKHIYALDGTPLCDPIEYELAQYPSISGTTYVYPKDLLPTPTPEPTDPPTDSTNPPADPPADLPADPPAE